MADSIYATPKWYLKAQDKDISSDIGRLTIYHLRFKQAAEGTLVFLLLDFSSKSRAILNTGTANSL
jgi:hypothetical protein